MINPVPTRKAQPRGCRLGHPVETTVRLRFDDFAGLDAARANADALARALNLGLHRTQIDVPAPPGRVVGVGDVVSELRTLAAKITFGCHDGGAPIVWFERGSAQARSNSGPQSTPQREESPSNPAYPSLPSQRHSIALQAYHALPSPTQAPVSSLPSYFAKLGIGAFCQGQR
jgi:hypothetical protein